MKPYGQKQEKSNLNIHPADCCSICSNDEWKIVKSRERHNDEEIDDYFQNKDTVIDFCELEHTVKIRAEEDDIFHSISNVIPLEARSVDPDDLLGLMANKFYKDEANRH